MKINYKAFDNNKVLPKKSSAGYAGFDNPRENIDPHVKTKVVSLKEIDSEFFSFKDQILTVTGKSIPYTASVSNPSITFEIGETGTYDAPATFQYKIYAAKYGINDTVFTQIGVLTAETSQTEEGTYDAYLSFTGAEDADFYRIVIVQDTYWGYTNDAYFDTTDTNIYLYDYYYSLVEGAAPLTPTAEYEDSFIYYGNFTLSGGLTLEGGLEVSGNSLFTGQSRFMGAVNQEAQGFSRVDIGVEGNTGRLVFEYYADGYTSGSWMIDNDQMNFRWFKPDDLRMVLNDNGLTIIGTGRYLSVSKLITGSAAPSASNSTGTTGTITFDSNYIYVCTATNTWKRASLSTW